MMNWRLILLLVSLVMMETCMQMMMMVQLMFILILKVLIWISYSPFIFRYAHTSLSSDAIILPMLLKNLFLVNSNCCEF